MAEETGQKQSKIQNLLELLQKTFLTVRDTINNQVKKHISLPDLQIGLEDEKYPPRGIIFPSRTAPPATTTNKLYNENGMLKFKEATVALGTPGADPQDFVFLDDVSIVGNVGVSGTMGVGSHPTAGINNSPVVNPDGFPFYVNAGSNPSHNAAGYFRAETEGVALVLADPGCTGDSGIMAVGEVLYLYADSQDYDSDSKIHLNVDGSDKVTVLNSGNTGIGTTGPDCMLHVAGAAAFSGPSETFVTFGSSDTTPSVATGNLFKTHASGQTLTMFDGGVAGQIINVISTAAVVYDVTSTNLKGGTTNITTANGDVTTWIFDGTNWYLINFMDQSADLSGGH